MDSTLEDENSTSVQRNDNYSPSGIQDTNPPTLPVKTTYTPGFDSSQCISHIENQETKWQEPDTETEGEDDSRELQRRLSENGNLVVQGRHHDDVTMSNYRLAHSWPDGRNSINIRMRQLPIFQAEHCMECRMMMDEISCEDTKQFWRAINYDCHYCPNNCFCKFYGNFIEKLKDRFPQEAGLHSRCTVNLLKRLFDQDKKSTCVTLANLVRVIKLFGPIRLENDTCVLIHQLHDIVKRSLKKRGHGKIKSSWFVGEMSRQEAETNLMATNCQDKSFLIRISGTDGDEGDFVLSIRHDDHCHHLRIQGNPRKALMETPYNAHLSFADQDFQCLSDVVDYITNNNAINIEQDQVVENGDIFCTSVTCLRVFPNSPLNQTLNGYERAKR